MTQTPVYFLLVDDLEENLLSLEALLRRQGLELLKARSGPEALELLLKHEVALALLDVHMLGMDGFELAELMRGTERTRRVPIIFLTAGGADIQRRFRGYEAGAVDFLHKPIEPDILKSKAQIFYELYRQQQLLAAQRDELKSFSEALQDANRRKDEFLATLAHELRNPLAPIRNALEILRASPGRAEMIEAQNIMHRQLTHLVRLIDDLLDASRINHGKIDLRIETVALQTVLQSALEASRSFIDAGHHRLTLDLPEDLLWVKGDMTRLSQILSNLLNNAAKYTPEGGHIALSARREKGEIIVEVADNGIGIDSDKLADVFEMFTQIDRTLESAQGGLGIGLALVKRLVQMHQGAIEAASAGPGRGSTFKVRLPEALAPAQDASFKPLADEAKPPQGAPLHVLVVDDNVDSAQTMGWMLELIGHRFTLAHDGLAALDIARALHPDVILLDIGLPGLNGYDVCRELRKDPAFEKTLLIAQTGWGQERDRQNAQEAGFDHHLIKPVSLDNLSRLLSLA